MAMPRIGIAASNAVIGLARERFTKNLRSERRPGSKPRLVSVLDDAAQVAFIVAAVLENREAGMPLEEQVVLFRTAHHSALLEIELARRNIPFVKYGGLKFIDAAHVKDMLAILRWAENPATFSSSSSIPLRKACESYALGAGQGMYQASRRAHPDWSRQLHA